jgi:iron complex outermembrane receptor protein
LADQFLAKSLDVSTALRYSSYSTFGGKLTGKAGIKWRPVDDLIVRGTFAEGFRAPSIGELFGLAQFGAVLSDPCSNSDGTSREQNCRNLGVPAGFQQINTQITTNTGGNPDLKPEKADSYTAGLVYSPSWADTLAWTRRLDFEATYYHHNIKDAIRAPDAQSRLNACVDSGDPNSEFCQGITRTPNGQINRFDNLLANIGRFTTDGVDLKINWSGPEWALGHFTAAWQNTFVNSYRATDALGTDFPQKPGVEVNDGAIPRLQSNLQLNWSHDVWSAGWTVRYISAVSEKCSDDKDNSPNSLTNLGLCSKPDYNDNSNSRNELHQTFYNDVQFGWNTPFGQRGLKLTAGVNNVLNQDPPNCESCTLNGYDAGTYDSPGQFGYLQASWKF